MCTLLRMAVKTKFIGIKEFRANIAEYSKKAQKGDARYVVMKRNKPLFEIMPFEEDIYLESFLEDIAEAERDIAAGRVYTMKQVKKMLGVKDK